jgi:uncharacterized protein (TIGR00730 family)
MKRLVQKLKSKNKSSLRFLARQERKHARRITDAAVRRRMKQINKEFKASFKLLMKHPDTVTFFGSARFKEDHPHYQHAKALSRRIVEELGSTIVTGGGGGIMAAANHGATEAKGNSIGMTIRLPHEQVTNPYVNYSVDFYYFFSRKVALSFTARAYIVYPGGFGTMDEFFEVLTLKQTGRIDPIPIVLVGKEFWDPLVHYFERTLIEKFGTVSPRDTKNFYVTDDPDEVIKLISRPFVRKFK